MKYSLRVVDNAVVSKAINRSVEKIIRNSVQNNLFIQTQNF